MPSLRAFKLTRPRAFALLCLSLLAAASVMSPRRWAVGAQESPVAPVARAKRGAAEFVPGEILVRFRTDAPAAAKGARTSLAVRAPGREIEVRIQSLGGAELVEGLRLARVRPEETEAALGALNARGDVLYAEPNYVRRKTVAPNDPRYAEQWGLKNVGQPVEGQQFGGIAGADVKAEQAWGVTTGSRQIVVGVVDEGVDISHPDLAANVWTNPGEVPANGVDDDGDGFIDDVHGWDFFHNDASVYDGSGSFPADGTDAHGTHVAGIVGASGDNGAGVAGVNWQVSLLPIKVLGPDGGADADIIRAYAYAKTLRDLWVSTNGARGANLRVLNNSYGGGGFSQAALDAIKSLNDSGILFVAGAGNDGADDDHFGFYPAGYDAPNVVAVAATTQTDALAPFSNFGARRVAVAAPGSFILSTTPGNTYSFFSGTSMASPHVAGAAALLCAARPASSVAQLRAALVFSGDPVPSLAGKVYGSRRLDIFAALQSAAEADATPPAQAGSLFVAGAGRAKTLSWIAPGDDANTGRAALYEIDFVDGATGATYVLATKLPAAPGAQESAAVQIPFRHTGGTLVVKTFDNAGNASAASVPVAVDADAAEPYSVAEGEGGAASTAVGNPINLRGDDLYYDDYTLPFGFDLFGKVYNSVTVSTNGALYFARPPRNADGTAADANSTVPALEALPMIAGLWDDLRTDRRPGDDVYVYQPTPDAVVFRWQAVTFDALLPTGVRRGENPVNFEIELRRDGKIVTRYGAGNANVLPVVGISGGEPDAYLVASHTVGSSQTPVSLDNAPPVTFKPHTFTISGHVSGAAQLTQIKLTGTRNFTNNLDASGNYVFHNLPAGGDYTVEPVTTNNLFRFVITPPRQTFNNLRADQTADFSVTIQSFSVRGRVVDQSGNGIAGVCILQSVPSTDCNVRTDAGGNFVFANLPAGQSYMFAPSAPGFTFTPNFRTVDTLNGDVTLADFVARGLFNVTGRVVDVAGKGLGGAFVSSGAPDFRSTNTDASGNYTLFQLAAGATHTVTASLSGYTIAPPSQIVASLDSNRALPDFVARPLFVLQGTVRDASGKGIGDATVSLTGAATKTVRTDANGGYFLGSFVGFDTYTVTVSKPFYTFDPPSQTFASLGAHQTSAFVGTLAANTILGRVTDATSGQGVGALTLALSGARSAATQTDAFGYYVFGDLTAGASYTVTPSSDAYAFTPTSLSFENFAGSRSADFRASSNARIDGSVVDDAGRGVGGVVIRLSDGQPNSLPQVAAQTDAAGQFTIANLKPGGNYRITASKDLYDFSPPSIVFNNLTGAATARFVAAPSPKTVEFAFPNSGGLESGGRISVLVTRHADTSAAASVNYSTVDDPSVVRCDDTTTKPGVAFARCDYATTVGTLTFAPGETTKTFFVSVINDAHVEPLETTQLKLSDPVGCVLGALTTSSLTIVDDEVPGAANPVVSSDFSFFVRQQYLDFFGREPDAGGFAAWKGTLDTCPDPFNTSRTSPSANCDRVSVSTKFFRSQEFELKGRFVFNFYRVAFGRLPRYSEIIPDMASLTAVDNAGFFANKAQFTNSFVGRQEFKNSYDGLSNQQFVDALMNPYNLSSVTTVNPASPDDTSAPRVTLTRADLVSRLNGAGGALTRAQVLRAVADSNEVSAAEANSAFVAMQYFGYLRRDPDEGGYNDWLRTINDNPADIRSMVNGFMNSTEYRLRFGQP
jgi:subtilisin family serine protease